MNKTIILAAISILILIPVYGQKPMQERFEEIKSHKVAYITSKLELTPEQAQKFWPVYNEYEKKRDEIYRNRHEIMKEIKENYEGADSKLEEISDRMINTFMEESRLQKEYHERYKKILPIKKVLMLYHAEQQFKRDMLRNIRDRRRPEREGRMEN